jgi:hypothetical protein
MDPIYDASRDQRLLAAYILGYRSRTLWIWHELFFNAYFVDVQGTTADPADDLQNGPPLVAEELEWARITSAKSINPNVFNALTEIIREFAGMPQKWIDRWAEMDARERGIFLARDTLGRQEWEKLKTLTDQAFDDRSQMWVYYDLGSRIGEYELAVNKIPDIADYLDRNTNIPSLINSARGIPAEVLEEMPLLGLIVRLESTWNNDGPRACFAAVFDKLDELRRVSPRGLARFPLQYSLICALHEEVCSTLEDMAFAADNDNRRDPQSNPLGKTLNEVNVVRSNNDIFKYIFYNNTKLFEYHLTFTTFEGKREQGRFPFRKELNGFSMIEHLLKNPNTPFGPIELENAIRPRLANSASPRGEGSTGEDEIERERWSREPAQDKLSLSQYERTLRTLQNDYKDSSTQGLSQRAAEAEEDFRRVISSLREDIKSSDIRGMLTQIYNSHLENVDLSVLNKIKKSDFKDLNDDRSPVGKARKRVGKAIRTALDRIRKKMGRTADYLESRIQNIYGFSDISYIPVAEFTPGWVFDVEPQENRSLGSFS